MASVYKRKQDKGNRRSCWYIGYKDHSGKRRTRKGFTDKAASERLAAELDEESRQIREGLKARPRPNKQERLAQQLDDFERHLRNRDITDKQVDETITRLNRMLSACEFATASDITSDAVESLLAKLRENGRSKQTSNHSLKAIKQFCRWLVRTGRHFENPVADIKRLNVETDRRHERRVLSSEELQQLVLAAQSGQEIESIPGPDRAMMYILSAWTGCRKGEIGSLTQTSFDMTANPPTVTVQAAFSKRKRQDVQVLHPDVALLLGFVGKLIFPGNS